MYRILYGRDPDAGELRLGREFVAEGKGGVEVWQRYAQALLLSNEFVFVD
jgi:hypothetical protein